mmetsp:Transcript_32780/g.103706  ORF Transcript_32780/g.103706 Transcript_32780/m.103706 type:complete len:104 (-) Transcript_32780:67-378(-)
MHDVTSMFTTGTSGLLSIDQPSFRDIAITSEELSCLPDVGDLSISDIHDALREEQKRQEEQRRAKYGCPSRSKQLQALKRSLKLLGASTRPRLISATGEELML